MKYKHQTSVILTKKPEFSFVNLQILETNPWRAFSFIVIFFQECGTLVLSLVDPIQDPTFKIIEENMRALSDWGSFFSLLKCFHHP